MACAGALGWLWALSARNLAAGIRTVDASARGLMTEVLQVGNGWCQPWEPLVGMAME